MKIKLFFLSLISLLTVAILNVNAAAGPMFNFHPSFIQYLLSKYFILGWFIPIVFAVEWYCVHQFIGKDLKGSFSAAVVINTVSFILGIPLVFFGIFICYVIPIPFFTSEQLAVFSIGIIPGYHVVKLAIMGLVAIVVNVIIESETAISQYKIKDKKSVIKWMIIANVLSSGVGFVSFGIDAYKEAERKREWDAQHIVTRRKLRGGGVLTKVRKRK